MNNLYTALATLGGAILFLLFAVLAVYVLNALGIYYVLNRLDFHSPWVAWIPVANLIALGLCCGDEEGKTRLLGVELPNIALALSPAFAILAGEIPRVGNMLSLVINIVGTGTIYGIIYARMEIKEEKECMALGYLSGLIGLIPLVKFLHYRFCEKAAGEAVSL